MTHVQAVNLGDDFIASLKEQYPLARRNGSVRATLLDIMGDSNIACTALDSARMMGGAVYDPPETFAYSFVYVVTAGRSATTLKLHSGCCRLPDRDRLLIVALSTNVGTLLLRAATRRFMLQTSHFCGVTPASLTFRPHFRKKKVLSSLQCRESWWRL